MITFNAKPISISPEYRVMYRIGQIVLVLGKASTRKTASLLKLHYFSWAMRSSMNMQSAIKLASDEARDYDFANVWNIEPSLNRALAFAKADRIINQQNGKYKLVDRGDILLNLIEAEPDVFESEKEFLSKVKRKITENQLHHIFKWWENQ